MANREFDGKVYTKFSKQTTKLGAEQVAKGMRNKGNLARITKEGKQYIVWVR